MDGNGEGAQTITFRKDDDGCFLCISDAGTVTASGGAYPYLAFFKERKNCNHEGIVTDEEFALANSKMKKVSRTREYKGVDKGAFSVLFALIVGSGFTHPVLITAFSAVLEESGRSHPVLGYQLIKHWLKRLCLSL